VSDRRSLSRREVLWATATIGAAASTGGGAAAVLSDTERTRSVVTAGILDLDSSWGNAADADDPTDISISAPSGRETITVSTSGNPSYVWFRTQCVQCTPDEEILQVRLGLDTDTDGTVDQWLEGFEGGGYLSLRAARDLLGDGVLLGDISPDETWHLVVDWRTETTTTTIDEQFRFGFHAAQTRHVMNAASVAPSWECTVVCNGEDTSTPSISWVAFCGDDGFEPSFTPALSDDEHTLLLDTENYTVPDSVGQIAIKYGQFMDVFQHTGQSSLTVGSSAGETFEHTGGNEYDGTDRDNANFCDGSAGCKYNFPGWEYSDATETSQDSGNDGTGNGTNGNEDENNGDGNNGNGNNGNGNNGNGNNGNGNNDNNGKPAAAWSGSRIGGDL
jgi:hypothetical protein